MAAKQFNTLLDTTPSAPLSYHTKRARSLEIGPQLRLTNKVAIERVYYKLRSQISNNFSGQDLADKPTQEEFSKLQKSGDC